jgi:tRNA-specific 2-thiouridylase
MKIQSQKTVVLGMSGGVDSSVAALLLQKQGYNVIGIFMKNFSDTKNKFTGECWWREELEMARNIASKLNIPLHVVDYESKYKNLVIKPMISGYASGKTPNPDIECNNLTKFPALLQAAKKFNADFIATGHYARIKEKASKFLILQGKDKTKDQSYFLYKLTQKELAKTLFPLGNMTKQQVRQLAKKKNFPNWEKHGSAGVCFIGNVPLRNYLQKHIKSKKGKVIDTSGNTIGTHQGASFYTIGQRVGPHIGVVLTNATSQKRWYVASKKANTLTVAPQGSPSLKISSVSIKNAHWFFPVPKSSIKARVRHLGSLIPCKISNNKVIFAKPQQGIASGQSVVFYRGAELVSGAEMSLISR